MRRFVPLFVALGCSPLLACSSSEPEVAASMGGPAWLGQPEILVSGQDATSQDCRTDICRHNENTDLVEWQGAIWLVHRTAQSQILGPNSSLHVYQSLDGGQSFVEKAVLPAPVDRDLRDPHFFVVAGELRIKALVRLPVVSVRDSDVDTISVLSRSSDGDTWSDWVDIGPPTWSFWRLREQEGTFYTAAYEDGDLSVRLFSSTDGETFVPGADIYTVSADTPLETELTFMPSGRLLALVRMDGTDDELIGDAGRLRTKVCWATAPYASFSCPDELDGQRLDGPLSFFWNDRLFVVARKHLQGTGKKRTALFELTGELEGGPLGIKEWGELPSAGDTSYAGVAPVDANRFVVSWYSGEIAKDEAWVFGMFNVTDIWKTTLDLSRLE